MSPMYQRWFRTLALAGGTLLLLGLAVVTVVRAASRLGGGDDRPTLDNLDLAAFVKPEIPDEQNAARWLEAGAGAVVWSDADRQTIGEASWIPHAEWSEDLRSRVGDVLDRHRGALMTLHHAAALDPASWGIDYSQGLDARVPDWGSVMWAFRLLLAEARQAFGGDRPDAGLESLATMSRLATSMEQEADEVMVLVGIATEQITYDVMKEALATPSGWASSIPFLDRLEALVPDLDHPAMLRRMVVNWAGKMTLGIESEDTDHRSTITGQSLAALQHASTADVMRAARAAMELVGTPCGAAPERFTDYPLVLGEPARGLIVGAEGGLNHAAAVARSQAAEAERQIVRGAIAVRRAGAAHGAYPADPEGIPELRRPDPFTGRPIRYSIGRDGSALIELDGAVDLLEPYVVSRRAAEAGLRAVLLPPPG